MLNDFDIQIGTKFLFGMGTELRVGEELFGIGARKVLVHYGSGQHLRSSGILDSIAKSLDDAGVAHVELGGVRPNPRLALVRKGVELCREEKVDAILAVGGGSVIDSAKAIGIGAASCGDVWDFFVGFASPEATLPVGVVLTCPASGSESSQVTVITDEVTHQKLFVSNPIIRPCVAFMNPSLSISLPAFPTACGITDMFCHVCERYFVDDDDFGVLDHMSEGILRSIVVTAPKLMDDLDDYGLRSEVMWAATVAQNNSLGMGRNQDWATHALANELSALFDMPHGASISAVMPSWMRYVCHANPRRFARFAQEVFSVRDEEMDFDVLSHEGISAVERFFDSIGMPTSLIEMAPSEDDIRRMVSSIDFSGIDGCIGSVMRLGPDDCRAIYEMAAGEQAQEEHQ